MNVNYFNLNRKLLSIFHLSQKKISPIKLCEIEQRKEIENNSEAFQNSNDSLAFRAAVNLNSQTLPLGKNNIIYHKDKNILSHLGLRRK
jgi:hypothetical protein